jgi:hypothetical protein
VQGGDEVEERTSPAVEPPHDDPIKFPPASSPDQLFALGPQACARADILDFQGDFPAAVCGVIAHRGELQRDRTLDELVGEPPL